MNIHFVVHESFESPAAIETWAKMKGHRITTTRAYAGESIPSTAENIDFLIVMGGPQSPNTTLEECPYFNAHAEMNLIRSAVAHKKLIVGVCLGAQLIGQALGAPVEKSPYPEVGSFPITLTEQASDDPIFSLFPKTFKVGHWHSDMPGLTADAQILAASPGCPRQLVKYSDRVWGFQCHFEFTKESIEGMIEHCREDTQKQGAYIQSVEQLKTNDYNEMNRLLFQFLDYMESVK